MSPPSRIFTLRFALVVSSGLCYFTALAMLTPVLPDYVEKSLGHGSIAVGIAVGAFAVGAILLRPFAGRIGDSVGRRVLIVGGALIVAVTTACYGFVHALWFLVLLRIASGFGEAGFFVGAATMITDLSPPERRGEAVSYWSVAVYGGLSFGPVLGSVLHGTAHYGAVWMVSAGLAFTAALIGLFTVEVEREAPATAPQHLLHRAAIGPGTVLFLGLIALAGFTAFIPLYVHGLGASAGAVFALYGVLILGVRVFGARIPDRLGGRSTGSIALGLTGLGVGLIAVWPTVPGLVAGTIVFAGGMSLMYPALLLLALDGVKDAERASVVGTFSSFFDASQGLGALICGTVVALSGNRGAFATGAVCAFAGLMLLRGRSWSRAPAPAVPQVLGMPSLLVTNDFPPKHGGIQSYLYELWRRLPPDETTVLTTAFPDAASWDAAQAFRVERVRERVLLPTRKLARRIDALAREVAADVIFLDPMLPLGLVGPRLTAAPYVVVAHGSEITGYARMPGSRPLARRVMRNAAAVVAAGSYPARASADAAGRVLAGALIPPGVDGDRFHPVDTDERAAIRRRFGLDPERPLVLGVSRLVPRKGFDVVIDAMATLPGFGRDGAQLAIAGAGRDRRRLERRARGRVRFLGRVPDGDLPALYACADLFAMCCRDRWRGLEAEGFGIVFLEAAACGVPWVAGRSGGSHEAVADGETGFVVDPRDVDAVRAAITRLLADADLRARMGEAARSRATGVFANDRLATLLEPVARGDLSAIGPLGR